MTPFLKPEWPAPARIKAFSSLRSGGKSLPPCNEFNLAFHVGDREADVRANRELLEQTLRLPAEPVWINQVHGTAVVEALPNNQDHDADASFTRATNQVCAIMTADCLPILLCDQQGQHAAAIHAGWRGLAKGVIANTIASLALDNTTLLAWLGPAIGPQKFEVGQEVYDAFYALDAGHQPAFTPLPAAKWLADIYALARLQLQKLGVTQIYGGNYCTYTQDDKFFSYRRDKGKTGRMASLISDRRLTCHICLISP